MAVKQRRDCLAVATQATLAGPLNQTPPDNVFRAYRIDQNAAKTPDVPCGRFVDMDETALDHGDVLIRVGYSSVNYKDALAATGRRRVVRRLPCVGGIDLSGTVVSSAAPRFAPGMVVMATGYELGVAHHGGYAEYALLPGGWVFPVPASLGPRDAMAIGTAGLTAAMAITRLEESGLRPERGPVLVSGASGGVGSLAIDMLAGRGYEVFALTGKPQQQEYLLGLGASRVMLRPEIEPSGSGALEKGLWAGAIDVLGGTVLAWMLAGTKPGGAVASIGDCEASSLEVGLLPFIMRGVSLIGVDSVYAGFSVREKAWVRLANDLRPRHLERIARVIGFDDLPGAFEDLIEARICGRTVVRIAAQGG